MYSSYDVLKRAAFPVLILPTTRRFTEDGRSDEAKPDGRRGRKGQVQRGRRGRPLAEFVRLVGGGQQHRDGGRLHEHGQRRQQESPPHEGALRLREAANKSNFFPN